MDEWLERLDKLDQIAEPDAAVRNDLAKFAADVMHLQLKSFHQELISYLVDPTIKELLVEMPRGFGKSTIVCVTWPLWELGRNRDIRIVIGCHSLSLSREWLSAIEQQMVGNSAFLQHFGNLVPVSRTQTWTDTEKVVIGRSANVAHPSLSAIGVTGGALGKHADIVIIDDPFNPEGGVPTEVQCQKVKEWFWKIIFPILEPQSKVVLIGTRFSDNDIYGELESKWKTIRYSALDDKGESIWPERWPTAELLKRKDFMGSYMFNLQYMNMVDSSGNILKKEWLKYYNPQDLPSDMMIYQGIDPCIIASPHGDYFVIITVGIKDNVIYLLDMIRSHGNFHMQLEAIKDSAERWKPEVIAIESNAAQVFLAESLIQDSTLPIKPLPSKGDPNNRYINMSVHFQAGRVRIPGIKDEQGNYVPTMDFQPFVNEWIEFPRGKHDDTLSAMAKVLEVASYSGPPAAQGSSSLSEEPEVKIRPVLPTLIPRTTFNIRGMFR